VLERLLEDLSFGAPEMSGHEITIDSAYVHQRLDPIVKNEDLWRYIL
jgi:ATP-dependent HslUV protease ATP-binding subunit HslU